MNKSVFKAGFLMFCFTVILNLIMWWAGLSFISSAIKSFGDCNQKYNIERYKVQTDWFCPTEDSKVDMILTKSEAGRRRR